MTMREKYVSALSADALNKYVRPVTFADQKGVSCRRIHADIRKGLIGVVRIDNILFVDLTDTKTELYVPG